MRCLIVILLLVFTSAQCQKLSSDKLLQQAADYIKAGAHLQALKPLQVCIEKFPLVAEAYHVRAVVWENLDKLPEALSDYNVAVELLPESPEILLSRGVLAVKLKRYDLAKADFLKLLRFKHTETNQVFFRVSDQGGVDHVMTTQSNVRDQYYNYLGLIEQGLNNRNTAILYFDSAITCNSKQPDYYAHRGLTKLESGQVQSASDDFYQALKLNPEHAVAKNNLATLKRKEGKIAEAERLLFEAKLTNAKNQQHHAQLALIQLESGRYAEAILNFDTAILIDARDGELLLARGQAKEKNRNLNGAIKDYGRAIAIDTEWPKAWFMQGNAFLKQGKLKEALENYSAAITLDDTYAIAYHNRAMTYLRLGDKRAACLDIRKAEKGMSINSQTINQICGN